MTSMRPWYRDLCLSAFTVLGFALPIGGALLMAVGTFLGALRPLGDLLASLFALAALAAGVLVVALVYRYVRARGATRLRTAYALLVLVWFPLWGLVVNHTMLDARCIRNGCNVTPHRPFAEPWVVAPVILHGFSALAFAISRRRPGPLRPVTEVLVLSAMLVGVVLHTALQVQLGAEFIALGLVMFPIGLPVISPALTVGLLAIELRDRLHRRGAEARASVAQVGEGAYRVAEVTVADTRTGIHGVWAWRTFSGATVLLGVYGVLSALLTGRMAAGVMAFTQTCGHTFSQLPVREIPVDCHYLCTVAARGHPWLVRPERMGIRAGKPIVVNRQLAVANAFEELLHARWPRFGRCCRTAYDRLALPVSRWIRWRVLADLVYLAMKPAEWLFYVALLLLDPGDPEARIARMYRP
jgi:hypothetical protein